MHSFLVQRIRYLFSYVKIIRTCSLESHQWIAINKNLLPLKPPNFDKVFPTFTCFIFIIPKASYYNQPDVNLHFKQNITRDIEVKSNLTITRGEWREDSRERGLQELL